MKAKFHISYDNHIKIQTKFYEEYKGNTNIFTLIIFKIRSQCIIVILSFRCRWMFSSKETPCPVTTHYNWRGYYFINIAPHFPRLPNVFQLYSLFVQAFLRSLVKGTIPKFQIKEILIFLEFFTLPHF